MVDIIISVTFFILLFLCAIYVFKDAIRRKKQFRNKNFIETNWDIRGAFVAWGIGSMAIISFTLAYYLNAFNNSSILGYLSLCLIGLGFFVASYLLSFNKIIISKDTGNIVAYGIIRKKKFNVKDVTFIKHTFETWKAYSNNKKLFTVGNRYHDSPNEFYVYIRKESGCKEKLPKGYSSRDKN